MTPISTITNQAYQTFTISTDEGEIISIELKFFPRINGWYITKLEYNDFVLNGVRIVNSFNFLRQYVNKLPFGLACLTEQGREPMFIEDFSTGASTLYYLNSDECKEYEEYLIESKV